VTRVDNSGNLTNIGNLTATGAITIASTGAGNDIIINGADILDVQDNATFAGTLGVTGATTLSGDVSANGNTTIGNATTDRLTVTAQLLGGTPLVFQGATDNGFATTFSVTDPTANNTIIVPNAGGTLAVSASGNIALSASGNLTLTGQVPIANGGTGASTAQAAINALAGLTTTGDLLYYDGTNATRLARGSNGQCLTATAGSIAWAACDNAGAYVQLSPASVQTDTSTNSSIFINKTAVSGNLLQLQVSATNEFVVAYNGDITASGAISGLSNISLTGAISGGTTYSGSGNINTTGGAVQTNSVTRVDNSGNLTNIGNLTATGAITIASTGAGNDIIINGADILDVQDNATFAGTLGVTGATTLSGDVSANGNTTIGNATTDRLTVTAQLLGGTPLVFQGATDNGFATTFSVTDPTANNTIIVPNAGGTLAVSASGNIALSASGNLTLTGQVPIANGGTGASSAQAAINALAGLTTTGDLLYYDGTNATRLARGSNGQCLTATAGSIAWAACDNAGAYVQLSPASVQTDTSTNSSIFINKTAVSGNLLQLQVSATNEFVVAYNGDITASGAISGLSNISLTGAISGGTTYSGSGNINTTGGAVQTNSVTRVDNSGNLTNIGNLTATGAITIASTGAGNDIIINGADILDVQDNATFAGTLGVTGATTLSGDVSANGNTTIGNATTDRLTVTAQLLGGTPLVFQGATDNGFATTFSVTDPTANNTITVPNAGGTLAVSASGNIALSASGNLTLTGQVPIANGGTGANTAQAAINALAGLTTTGDLLYYDGTNATRLARGSNGQCLTATAGSIAWAACDNAGAYVQLSPASVQTDTSTNSSIFINKTAVSGNLLQLQVSATNEFVVAYNGDITASGAISGLSNVSTHVVRSLGVLPTQAVATLTRPVGQSKLTQ
jgi:fibronectin-binding autotransporter adhesin